MSFATLTFVFSDFTCLVTGLQLAVGFAGGFAADFAAGFATGFTAGFAAVASLPALPAWREGHPQESCQRSPNVAVLLSGPKQ